MALVDLQIKHSARGYDCDPFVTSVLKALQCIKNPTLFIGCFYLRGWGIVLPLNVLFRDFESAKVVPLDDGVRRQIIRLRYACLSVSVPRVWLPPRRSSRYRQVCWGARGSPSAAAWCTTVGSDPAPDGSAPPLVGPSDTGRRWRSTSSRLHQQHSRG